MKKQYDFTNLKDDKFLNLLNDAIIQEKIKKNTIYIDNSIKNKELILQKYIDYCNYKSSFIKKDFCFTVFCKYFTLYKNNNINIEYNKIKSKIDFLKDDKNKKLIDVCFTTNTMDSLYKLFLAIKNDR